MKACFLCEKKSNVLDFNNAKFLKKSLKQKMLRTIFVNSMWLNATEPDCIKFSAENNGWLLLDGFLKPTWFLGDSTPTQVECAMRVNEQILR